MGTVDTFASRIDVFVYIVLVLFLTTVWVYVYRHRSFTFLALAMFFPGLLAFVFNLAHGTLVHFVSFLFFNPQWSTIFWAIFASLSSIMIVVLCCLINYAIGWGEFHREKITSLAVHEHNRNLFFGWIRALGEEIGWRSYLLPGLLIHFHPFIALNISGLVWGLYHLPIMILLSTHSHYPIRTIVVQCVSCWISAFVYGWIAIQCHYSVLPATMAHFVWNRINPFLLGSIYTNTQGWISGEQWKINGEGLMGCLVYLIPAAMITIQLW